MVLKGGCGLRDKSSMRVYVATKFILRDKEGNIACISIDDPNVGFGILVLPAYDEP
jgi:hypothetical protein